MDYKGKIKKSVWLKAQKTFASPFTLLWHNPTALGKPREEIIEFPNLINLGIIAKFLLTITGLLWCCIHNLPAPKARREVRSGHVALVPAVIVPDKKRNSGKYIIQFSLYKIISFRYIFRINYLILIIWCSCKNTVNLFLSKFCCNSLENKKIWFWVLPFEVC